MKTFTIQQINEKLQGKLYGNTHQAITGPEQLQAANNNQITFIGTKKYSKFWENSKACAAIVSEGIELEPGENKAIIQVKNADIAMAEILEMFVMDAPVFYVAIHPAATIDSSAKIGTGCKIGSGCYIGQNVTIGNNSILYANVTVLDATVIGNGTIVWPGVVIRERCVIGSSCIIHPNTTIGADGFGFRASPDGKGIVKIPHIGNVIIGNAVEIGANSCVDRGKFSSTIIGDGTKIDNLVQIGHNCKLGRSCLIAGASALAGSVTLGDGCIIGGSTKISDHVTLGKGVMVGGNAGVISDFPDGSKIMGFPAVDARDNLKQWAILRRMVKDSK